MQMLRFYKTIMFAMMIAGYGNTAVAMMLKENVNPTTAAKCPKLLDETAHVRVVIDEDVSKITPAIKLMLMKPRDAKKEGVYEEKMELTYRVCGIGECFGIGIVDGVSALCRAAHARHQLQHDVEAAAREEAKSRQNMRGSHGALWQHRQQPPASEWAELW
jgi:hypothetical protein